MFPVHRLDKETTGLVVLARTQRTAAELSRSITEGLFQKEYLAAICGTPQEPEGCWTDLLFYDRNRGKSFVVDRKRGGVKEATLSYRVIESDGNRSVVRVRLHTGRTHQIRVQFSSRGLPLVGDRRYGAPAEEGRQLMLHAKKSRRKIVCSFLVEHRGFEPLTPTLPVLCAPNCANAPCFLLYHMKRLNAILFIKKSLKLLHSS